MWRAEMELKSNIDMKAVGRERGGEQQNMKGWNVMGEEFKRDH